MAWTCFTCNAIHVYNPAPAAGGMWNLPAEYECVTAPTQDKDEVEVPVAIRYQCAACARLAKKHRIAKMDMEAQIRFRSWIDAEMGQK